MGVCREGQGGAGSCPCLYECGSFCAAILRCLEGPMVLVESTYRKEISNIMSSFNRCFKMFVLFLLLPFCVSLLLPVTANAPRFGQATQPCAGVALLYHSIMSAG